jgi:hypothetical protein
MAPKYLPRNDAELLVWLQNLRDALPTHASAVGMDAATQKAVLDQSSQLSTALAADEKAYQAYRAAVAHSATIKASVLTSITAAMSHVSTAPGCTDAIRTALRLQGPHSQQAAPSTYKVPLSPEVLPGRVVLGWRKGPLDGVNVYSQRGTDTEWRLLGRDNRPPFDDLRPLEKSGVPEQRRYRVIGVIGDIEVTPESDVVSVTVAS